MEKKLILKSVLYTLVMAILCVAGYGLLKPYLVGFEMIGLGLAVLVLVTAAVFPAELKKLGQRANEAIDQEKELQGKK